MISERESAFAELRQQKRGLEVWLKMNGWPWNPIISGWLDRVITMLDGIGKHD